MTQIFPSWFDALARAGFAAAFLAVPATAIGLGIFYRSDYTTAEHTAYRQPVPFSHQHHVSVLGIDCRYCHTSVEDSSFAGIPPTETCMNCHEQIWVGADTLAPVRQSWKNGTPLHWHRVNSVPGFVYFHHGIHVQKGVGCVECHGRVDQMPLTWQEKPLTMGWCLDCHRDPGPHLRPKAEVFNMKWTSPEGTAREKLSRQLMSEYEIRGSRALTSCSTCHR